MSTSRHAAAHEAVSIAPDPSPRPALRLLTTSRRIEVTPEAEALYRRATILWPGLDRRQLTRTKGDPRRVARLIARRTALPEESILILLLA
jgi:hypothetical protein